MNFEEIIKDNVLNETIFRKKYENGLDAYVLPKKGFSKSFASLTVKYGSNDSNFVPLGSDRPIKVPDGVAHFLEHKMFEKEYGSVFERFDKLGVSANAYTTNTHTSYYFISTDNYYEALNILLEFVQVPYFTDETVEKEKGIIIQELRMYNDDPEREIFNNLLNSMFIEHPVKIDVGGTVESVRSIDKDVLYLCYNSFYKPDNMIFLSIGDVDPGKIFDYVEKRIVCKQQGEIKRIYSDEPDQIKESYIEKTMNVSMPLMILGFKDISKETNTKLLLKKYVDVTISLEALFGKSSEIYSELYNKGLITSNLGYEYEAELDYGFVLISCSTASPQKVNEEIREYIKTKSDVGIDEGEFMKAKRVIKGAVIKAFDSIETLGHFYNSFMVKGINVFEYIDVINNTTLSEVNERWKSILDFDRAVLSVIKPEERI